MLAEERKCSFFELSHVVLEMAGCPVPEIYSLYGEAAYRKYERRAVEHAIEKYPRAVIAMPGGLVGEGETYNLVLKHYFTVWLSFQKQHDTAEEGEKEEPDTHRITRKAGPTGGSEFNAIVGQDSAQSNNVVYGFGNAAGHLGQNQVQASINYVSQNLTINGALQNARYNNTAGDFPASITNQLSYMVGAAYGS